MATSRKHEVLLTSDSSGQLWNCCVWDPTTGASLTSYKVGNLKGRVLRDEYFLKVKNQNRTVLYEC